MNTNKVWAILIGLLLLSGCGNKDENAAKEIVPNSPTELCKAVSSKNWNSAIGILESIVNDLQEKNRKLSAQEISKYASLLEDAKKLKEEKSKFTAGLNLFCEAVNNGKTIQEIVQDENMLSSDAYIQKHREIAKKEAETFQSQGARWSEEDYFRALWSKFPYYFRDSANPYAERFDGIIAIFRTYQYDCGIWVFDSFDDFQNVANYTLLQFDADIRNDAHGNVFAVTHGIYSTSCTIEASNAFG